MIDYLLLRFALIVNRLSFNVPDLSLQSSPEYDLSNQSLFANLLILTLAKLFVDQKSAQATAQIL